VLKGLLLDFYGTVVEDDDEAVDAIAAQVASRASRPVDAAGVARAWMRGFEEAARARPFRRLRQCAVSSLAAVMAEVGCADDAASIYAAQHAARGFLPLRAGTREFLARVAVPVCVLSDADREDLFAVMAHHGLTFTAVVTSEDVGAYKPDAAMFARALDALGLAAHEVVHVGDSLTSDVAGAHAAGIRAVWVNRHGRAAPAGAPIAYEIERLSELLAEPLLGAP
jgi:2-haloacid dehalogenase